MAEGQNAGEEESKESIYALMGAGASSSVNQPGADNAAVNTVNVNQIGISSDSSYLIVDLRDKSDWLDWHVKESYSLPLMLIN